MSSPGSVRTLDSMPHLDATFTIDAWEDAPYEGEGITAGLGAADVVKTYAGDLVGRSTARLLLARGDGGAAYLAQEVVVGTIAGRSGAFVLQHGAAGAGEGRDPDGAFPPRQWAFVVPGSATGALAGLAGRASSSTAC